LNTVVYKAVENGSEPKPGFGSVQIVYSYSKIFAAKVVISAATLSQNAQLKGIDQWVLAIHTALFGIAVQGTRRTLSEFNCGEPLLLDIFP
jgi:hypothetical protein